MYMLNRCMVKAAFKQELILDACLQAIGTNQPCVNKNNTKYITIYYVEQFDSAAVKAGRD